MTPSAVKRLFTIGVYDWDLQSFLGALRNAEIGLLLDVRQRRGVRGPQYAWANSVRLQGALAEAGIAYEHHKELAPTTELRRLQYAADARQNVGKRSRMELAAEYRLRYEREILDQVTLTPLIERLPDDCASTLLCVEQDPVACHRSMIAERIACAGSVEIGHLRPRRTGGPTEGLRR